MTLGIYYPDFQGVICCIFVGRVVGGGSGGNDDVTVDVIYVFI